MQIDFDRITIAIVVVAFIIVFILSQIAMIYSGREGVYQWLSRMRLAVATPAAQAAPPA